MRPRVLTLALALGMSASGCTSFSESVSGSATETPAEQSTSAGSAGSAVTTVPGTPLTVLADPDPVVSAAAMSRALFARSPVVVMARAGDHAGVLLGASTAVALGAPLLLEPEEGRVSDTVAAEVTRLDAGTVLAVGKAGGRAGDGEQVISVPGPGVPGQPV